MTKRPKAGGPSAIEYGLVAALVAGAAIAAMHVVGHALNVAVEQARQ